MAYASTNDVSDRIGRPLSSSELLQVSAWLSAIEAKIEARFARAGYVLADQVALNNPSVATLVDIEAEVAIRRLNQPKPGAPSSVTRSVDDGSLTQRWDRAPAWSLTDEEWVELLPVSERGAFTIRPWST